MTGPLRPWRPEDFDDRGERCDAAPGQTREPWCGTGFTAGDACAGTEPHDTRRGTKPTAP
ncbi:hypothetical protein QFZ24_010120 [Streptomyces phaeochromogenes]|uniref:hypothetical protein n=1 Tax=Streptomyces phaeochromogenes TaxID=1923 RepID=UPI00278D18AC|nr:hypothetical protein [Streptomyces phaeochromogenes]MDQ0956111.1 hypothetical protein [Streptomyces phaeochromogenes]